MGNSGTKTLAPPDTKPEVSFRTSTSTTQGLRVPHHFDKPGVRAKELFVHPAEWLKYRFTGEHLLGSILQLFNMYSTFELMRNGLDKKDSTRIYGGASATALTAWAFLSARGAKQPEGENFTQRFIDTVSHPEESLVQFAWLGSFPINVLCISGDLYHGYKSQQSDKSGDLKKIGLSRLTQGGANIAGSALIFSSLFKSQRQKKEQTPVVLKNSHSTPQSIGHHIKEVSRFAFRHDKGGLLGRSLLISTKIGKMYEAVKSIQLERAGETDLTTRGGGKLLRSSLVGLCVYVIQSYYEYSCLYRDGKERLPASQAK